MVRCILSNVGVHYLLFHSHCGQPVLRLVSWAIRRKKPSLSASRIATSDTSKAGLSPHGEFTPMSTSKSPLRRSCIISTRSNVSTSLANVTTPNTNASEVFGKFLCHSLGEGGYQYALIFLGTQLYFLHKVIYLIGTRTHFYFGVEQSCGAYHLFYVHALRLLELVGWGGTHFVTWFVRLQTPRISMDGCPLREQSETVFTRFSFLLRSPPYIACTCETVTWLSSITIKKSSGK